MAGGDRAGVRAWWKEGELDVEAEEVSLAPARLALCRGLRASNPAGGFGRDDFGLRRAEDKATVSRAGGARSQKRLFFPRHTLRPFLRVGPHRVTPPPRCRSSDHLAVGPSSPPS